MDVIDAPAPDDVDGGDSLEDVAPSPGPGEMVGLGGDLDDGGDSLEDVAPGAGPPGDLDGGDSLEDVEPSPGNQAQQQQHQDPEVLEGGDSMEDVAPGPGEAAVDLDDDGPGPGPGGAAPAPLDLGDDELEDVEPPQPEIPVPTKVYDTNLALHTRKNQKIPYPNEDGYAKTLIIRSSDEELLRIRHANVTLQPYEKGKLALQFLEHDMEEVREFLIYVMDDETEDLLEVIQINAIYGDPPPDRPVNRSSAQGFDPYGDP